MFLSTHKLTGHSLPYQRRYDSFLAALHKDYSGSQDEIDPLEPFPGARALLDQVQMDTTLSPEEVLDHLLDAVIVRFGYSGRDVFRAVFDYQLTTDCHQAAFNIKFTDLEDAASTLVMNEVTTSIFLRILALSPVYSGPYTNDKWNVNFKS